MIGLAIDHLRTLVGFDTTNPPRAIDPRHPAITHVSTVLEDAGFALDIEDLGDGCVNVMTVRGAPRVVVNCHLDTVPAGSGWDTDPCKLVEAGSRLVGLGACDVKGAASAILAAAQRTSGDAAVLMTTDEEAGAGRCVRRFLGRLDGDGYGAWSGPLELPGVIVSEPTNGRAIVEHRGILAVEGVFEGRPGHASVEGLASSGAMHRAIRWAHRVIALAETGTLRECRVNIGMVDGGSKANVVPARVRVVVGLRPPGAMRVEDVVDVLGSLLDPGLGESLGVRFAAPGLSPRENAEGSSGVGGRGCPLAQRLGVEVGEPVDFWTEAALFARSGLDALVFGPGDIGRAHAAGEWITREELAHACEVYSRVFSLGADGAPGSPGRG